MAESNINKVFCKFTFLNFSTYILLIQLIMISFVAQALVLQETLHNFFLTNSLLIKSWYILLDFAPLNII